MLSAELSEGVGAGPVDHWIQSEPSLFFVVTFFDVCRRWLDLAGRTETGEVCQKPPCLARETVFARETPVSALCPVLSPEQLFSERQASVWRYAPSFAGSAEICRSAYY